MDNQSYNLTDHDLLIALHEQMKQVRVDIKALTDGSALQLADHEKRLRSLEDMRQEGQGMNKIINGAWGALSGAVIIGLQYYFSKR